MQILLSGITLVVIAAPTGLLVLRLLPIAVFVNRPAETWTRFMVAIPVSLCVSPLAYSLVGVVTPLTTAARAAVWLALNGILWGVGTLVGPKPRPSTALYDHPRQFYGVVLISVVALLIPLYVFLIHNARTGNLYWNVGLPDWEKHIAVGSVLVSDDHLPPANPFIDAEPKLKYYYFSYIDAADVRRLWGNQISVANALFAWAALIALVLPSLLYVYGRTVGLSTNAALFATFLVTLVSGFDIIPVAKIYLSTGRRLNHIDAWTSHDIRRINSISDMFSWTPQHTEGIICFIILLWLLHELFQAGSDWRLRLGLSGAAAWLLANLAGISSFVWFGAVAGLVVFVVFELAYDLIMRRDKRPLLLLVVAIIISLGLSLPYLLSIRGPKPFILRVSPTRPGVWFGAPFGALLGQRTLTYLLDFPGQMVVEFGPALITGVLGWAVLIRQRHPAVRLWSTLIPVFFFVVLAVRPDRMDSNNYAARVAPMAWVILGIMSGFWWMNHSPVRLSGRFVWGILLLPGIASTFYEPGARQTPNYSRLAGINSTPPSLGYVTKPSHDIYVWLNAHTDPDAVVQMGRNGDQAALFYVERKTAFSGSFLADLYLSDEKRSIQVQTALNTAFDTPDAEEAAQMLKEVDISYVITQPIRKNNMLNALSDPVFKQYFFLEFQTDYYQIYRVVVTSSGEDQYAAKP